MDQRKPQTFSSWLFAAMALGITIYVALCTPHRDNVWLSDAWEHHRAVLALVEDPSGSTNPTFAVDTTSIRYSPYSVVQAWVARSFDVDAYEVLSGAAVFNTVLLLCGVWLLLRRFGEERAAPAVLLVLVFLYGGAPGYSSSIALADLPWHQNNASAFALALCPWCFVGMHRVLHAPRGEAVALGLLVSAATAVILLTHGMTGVFAGVGFAALAWEGPFPQRLRALAVVGAVSAGAAAISLLWPYYDFADVLKSRPDNDYWFNPWVLEVTLVEWCLPPLLASIAVLPLRHRPLIRFALLAGWACYAAGLFSYVSRSPTVARLPVPGVVLLNLAIGVWAHEIGLLRPATWPGRLRRLASDASERASGALVEVAIAFSLVYFGLPQLISIVSEPHLARPYVAPLVGREDKQLNLRRRFDALLEPVGRHEVVLSDQFTSWPVPSSSGRIVTAEHWEFFVSDQAERRDDVEAFFSAADDVDRQEILERYGVRWILLNRAQIGDAVFSALLDPEAVVREDGDLVLMSVEREMPAPERAS